MINWCAQLELVIIWVMGWHTHKTGHISICHEGQKLFVIGGGGVRHNLIWRKGVHGQFWGRGHGKFDWRVTVN